LRAGRASRATPIHQTLHPGRQQSVSKRMGATVTEAASRHVPMPSQPDMVLKVVRTAALAAKNKYIEYATSATYRRGRL